MIECNLTTKAKTGILWALAHHASNLRPVVVELFSLFYLTDATGLHDSWRRNGRQSTYVAFAGKKYFLRAADNFTCIEVRKRALGPVIWRLKTRADVLGWGRTVGLT